MTTVILHGDILYVWYCKWMLLKS